ncbi:PEP-CTERM sorting domain-containing protein [Trichormus sp. NMC-1]|uniref:PEP-CTERM sorting domain-containing protein n=1 Tax=Trichormus sp. NMC-1 TaxID=1853259 RepID=UPI00115FC295|nr:PEP-CTERM sorting domain-containing protein [Trichormus sp. NMC-1]
MKLSRILPLVVGSAVAGMVVSGASPAQALDWTWSYTGTGVNAAGTFTTNDTPNGSGFYTISAITGTRNSNTINSLLGAGVFGNNNLISLSSPYLTNGGAFAYFAGGNPFNVSYSSATGWRDSNISVTFTASASTPVPFDIPGGATIPTVGSLFALGLMRQAKKRLAAKTLVVNPVVS